MQDVSRAIKDLSSIEFPTGLHGRIMRRLVFLKFRTPFTIVVSLLLMNLVVSGARVWNGMSEFEAPTIISFLWENIEFSTAGIAEFFAIVYEVTPLGWLAIFVLNILLFAYVAYFPVALRNMKSDRVESLA